MLPRRRSGHSTVCVWYPDRPSRAARASNATTVHEGQWRRSQSHASRRVELYRGEAPTICRLTSRDTVCHPFACLLLCSLWRPTTLQWLSAGGEHADETHLADRGRCCNLARGSFAARRRQLPHRAVSATHRAIGIRGHRSVAAAGHWALRVCQAGLRTPYATQGHKYNCAMPRPRRRNAGRKAAGIFIDDAPPVLWHSFVEPNKIRFKCPFKMMTRSLPDIGLHALPIPVTCMAAMYRAFANVDGGEDPA